MFTVILICCRNHFSCNFLLFCFSYNVSWYEITSVYSECILLYYLIKKSLGNSHAESLDRTAKLRILERRRVVSVESLGDTGKQDIQEHRESSESQGNTQRLRERG